MQAPLGCFPHLSQANHIDTSPPDSTYNCHAWALGYKDRWFDDQNWWPEDVPRGERLEHYKRAYQELGFRVVGGGWSVEPGFEKIAIYVYERKVTHTARLLETGRWTSKMGHAEDITHTAEALDGPVYGRIALIMRRRLDQVS